MTEQLTTRKLKTFTNIPNPYNAHLWEALRAKGVELEVVYKGLPASEGRPWSILPNEEEWVAGRIGAEIAAARSTTGMDVLLSGGYFGSSEIIRRVVAPTKAWRTMFWGERLRNNSRLGQYRRWYFGGLTSIFAIGSWARPSYQAVVPARTPVHVFPYTTAESKLDRHLPDALTVGFVGSLIHRKGLDVLLAALAQMPAGRRPRLEVAGSGPLRVELEARAREAALHVEWLGELDPAELAVRRAGWSVAAVPSRYDGWGVVVSEAMAAGVPVIASPEVGAARDLIRPGFNGSIARTTAEWSAAISRYLDNKVAYHESANAAVIGNEMSSRRAADWLMDVLPDAGGCPRNFVAEAWVRVQARA